MQAPPHDRLTVPFYLTLKHLDRCTLRQPHNRLRERLNVSVFIVPHSWSCYVGHLNLSK